MNLPAITYATPAEARACLVEWKAWEKQLPKAMEQPLPIWIAQVMFRLGQLCEEKHPMRYVHEQEIVDEYAKLSKLWAERI